MPELSECPYPATVLQDRLDSWKEIAVYLRRDVRTVQLWEHYEGLPVYRLRHNKQSSVYSFRMLLDEWWVKRSTPFDFPNLVRIAVLPFQNLGDDTEHPLQVGFTDGLTDELLAQLRQLYPTKLTVILWSPGNRNMAMTLRDIGRESKARFILQGTVRSAKEGVRISVQLVHGKDEGMLWSEIYERRFSETRLAQVEVAKSIARSLGQLEGILAESTQPATSARDAYLKGRYHWNKRTERGFRKAIAYFEDAVEADHDYALAYAGMGDALLLLGYYTCEPPQQTIERAWGALKRALQIGKSRSEVHTTNGELALHQGEWQKCEKEFRLAITLNPRNATAHCWYANFLSANGQHHEALAEIRTALALDPVSPLLWYQAGMLHYQRKAYDQAIDQFLSGLDLDENFPLLHWGLALCLERQTRYSESVTELQKSASISLQNQYIDADLGYVLARSGNSNAGRQYANRLTLQSKTSYVCPYHLAKIHAALGDSSKAFELLQRAYNERSSWIKYLAVDPQFDILRADPRFVGMVAKACPSARLA